MAAYAIPYVEITVPPTPAFPSGRLVRRPVLFLALRSGAHRLSCYAIVDSGADHCVFPRSFMGPLALDQTGVGLLGQTGFFERFKITFDYSKKIYSIEIP